MNRKPIAIVAAAFAALLIVVAVASVHGLLDPGRAAAPWTRVAIEAGFIAAIGAVAIVGIRHALSERGRAEEQVRRSEREYRTLFENTGTAMVIVEEDSTISLANEGFARLSGFRRDEVEGKKSWTEFVAKEDLDRMREYHRARRIDRERAPTSYEFRFVDREGQQKDIFLAIDVLPDGKRSVASLLDITERKQAERQLEASERKYRALIENTNEMVLVIQDGMIIYSNPVALELGYSEKEIRTTPFHQFIHPDDRQMVLERHQKRLSGAELPAVYEFRILDRSQRTRWVAISAARIDWEGRPATLNLLTDVTDRKQAEDERRRSHERYSRLFEQSRDAIYIVRKDGSSIDANEAFIDLLGYNRDELAVLNAADMYADPRGRDRFLREIGEKGSLVGDEVKFKRKDGTVLECVRTVTTLRDGEGGVIGYQGIIRDVTEQKRREERLRRLSEYQRTIIDNANVWLDVLDEKGSVVIWNRAAEAISGYSADEVVGHGKIWEWLYPDEEYRKQITDRAAAIIRGEVVEDLETVIRTKGGEYRTISWHSRNLTDQKGQPTGSIALGRDVTQRKLAEQALRQSEQEFRALFEQMGDAAFVVSPDGTIDRVNRAGLDLFGYSWEDMLGMDVRKLYADPAERSGFVEQLEREGALANYEIRERKKSGELMDCFITSSVLHAPDGAVTGYLTVVRDITERKRMQEQLMLADRLASVGELVSGVAHELNNPLTAVTGYSELLMEQDLPDDVKEDVATIKREGDRAVKIVRDLLTFARKHPASKQLVNVNRVIEDVLGLRAYEHQVHNIEVVRELAADLPEVVADYHQLQQVFLNLVVNAEHFMLEANGRGRLTVRTETTDDTVRASVTDDGPGIPADTVGHVFDPFFTTKEVGKGTGLGLSISHGIVTEHGGRIWVESEEGKGATFVVELPVRGGQSLEAEEK